MFFVNLNYSTYDFLYEIYIDTNTTRMKNTFVMLCGVMNTNIIMAHYIHVLIVIFNSYCLQMFN